MNYPNIFTSQSKEFSQDAFIDWLLRCADPSTKDLEIREMGQDFIRMIVEKHNVVVERLHGKTIKDIDLRLVEDFTRATAVQVKRQRLNIDVLAKVNKDISIIFENKLGTSLHSDQLRKYHKELRKHREHDIIIGVYYKVLEECNQSRVEEEYGYCSLSRGEMLQFLLDHMTDNPIVVMYARYLAEIESNINGWVNTRVDDMGALEWPKRTMWSGFFSALSGELKRQLRSENQLKVGWGWINNASGGFHALWLGNWIRDSKQVTVYLQCNENELTVRMDGEGRSSDQMHSAWAQVEHHMKDEMAVKKASRMLPGAKSAEIGKLVYPGSSPTYLVKDTKDFPDVRRTAGKLISLSKRLAEITDELPKSTTK